MEEFFFGGGSRQRGRMGGMIIDEEDIFKRHLPGGISIHRH